MSSWIKALFYALSDWVEVCSFAGKPRVSALRCSTILLNLLIAPLCFLRSTRLPCIHFFFALHPLTIAPSTKTIWKLWYLPNHSDIEPSRCHMRYDGTFLSTESQRLPFIEGFLYLLRRSGTSLEECHECGFTKPHFLDLPCQLN